MHSISRLLAVILCLGVLSARADWPPVIPTPYDSNYCTDEAVEWVKKKFGEATVIEGKLFDRAGEPGNGVTTGFMVWVWTDLCEDAFLFGYSWTPSPQCKVEQYGYDPVNDRQRFLHSVGARGDCKRLLPRPEYPNE